MQWRISARDCLYVNWALPRAALPPAPEPLRYEVHTVGKDQVVLASAILFHVEGLKPAGMPGPGLSFPQMSLRFYVLDGQSVPSVLLMRLLMPWWVVPASRWIGRQPARAAHLQFPRPLRAPDQAAWEWRARAPAELHLVGRPGAGHGGVEPDLGNWTQTVGYFRSRSRAYAQDEKRLRERADERSTEPMPLEIRVERSDLLQQVLPAVEPEVWGRPHSAWLCPEIPVVLELGELRSRPLVPSLSAHS